MLVQSPSSAPDNNNLCKCSTPVPHAPTADLHVQNLVVNMSITKIWDHISNSVRVFINRDTSPPLVILL